MASASGQRETTLTLEERIAQAGRIEPWEEFWRDHQPWLEEKGYKLRPRYRPNWKPSWEGTDSLPWEMEDGVSPLHSHILDATRIADGKIVTLKKLSKDVHPFEVEISKFFSTEPLASHPRNHCVPVYDVLDVPDEENTVLLVLPLLRSYDDPPFRTVGEMIDFFSQVFEGLQFMHQCHVAHRDCMNLNIMLDPTPLYPRLYHPIRDWRSMDFKTKPKHYSRTSKPTKYYFIDFGLSRKYEPDAGPPLEFPILGGDKTVPEFQNSDEACNPFPTDIYYLGNLIREDFLQKFENVGFMAPLVADMVQDDPSKRPTIGEVVARYEKVKKTLPWWKLRSRLVHENEATLFGIPRAIGHAVRTIGHIMTLRPAVPSA